MQANHWHYVPFQTTTRYNCVDAAVLGVLCAWRTVKGALGPSFTALKGAIDADAMVFMSSADVVDQYGVPTKNPELTGAEWADFSLLPSLTPVKHPASWASGVAKCATCPILELSLTEEEWIKFDSFFSKSPRDVLDLSSVVVTSFGSDAPSKERLVTHSFLVDVDRSSAQHLHCFNTWGPDWADQGTFRISLPGTLDCVGDRIALIEIKISESAPCFWGRVFHSLSPRSILPKLSLEHLAVFESIRRPTYADVFRATYNGEPVAAKFVGYSTPELQLGVRLNHPQVVNWRGIILDAEINDRRLRLEQQSENRDIIIVGDLSQVTLGDRGVTDHLAKKKTRLANLVSCVAEGVRYLASLGIAHRNITPQNIIFTDHTWKLKDFSAAIGGGIVQSHDGVLTPNDWIDTSDEPITKETIDRIDVFSVAKLAVLIRDELLPEELSVLTQCFQRERRLRPKPDEVADLCQRVYKRIHDVCTLPSPIVIPDQDLTDIFTLESLNAKEDPIEQAHLSANRWGEVELIAQRMGLNLCSFWPSICASATAVIRALENIKAQNLSLPRRPSNVTACDVGETPCEEYRQHSSVIEHNGSLASTTTETTSGNGVDDHEEMIYLVARALKVGAEIIKLVLNSRNRNQMARGFDESLNAVSLVLDHGRKYALEPILFATSVDRPRLHDIHDTTAGVLQLDIAGTAAVITSAIHRSIAVVPDEELDGVHARVTQLMETPATALEPRLLTAEEVAELDTLTRDVSFLDQKRHLGAGAIGSVYQVVFQGAVVAVKLFRAGTGAAKREAMRLHSLAHSNIVPILAYSEGPTSFIVMPAYTPLERVIHELNPTDVFIIALCTARALHHIHLSGRVHRDIKPENIVVQLKEVNGQRCVESALLVDFGSVLTELREGHSAGGTTRFYLDNDRDTSTSWKQDVFALGTTIAVIHRRRLPVACDDAESFIEDVPDYLRQIVRAMRVPRSVRKPMEYFITWLLRLLEDQRGSVSPLAELSAQEHESYLSKIRNLNSFAQTASGSLYHVQDPLGASVLFVSPERPSVNSDSNLFQLSQYAHIGVVPVRAFHRDPPAFVLEYHKRLDRSTLESLATAEAKKLSLSLIQVFRYALTMGWAEPIVTTATIHIKCNANGEPAGALLLPPFLSFTEYLGVTNDDGSGAFGDVLRCHAPNRNIYALLLTVAALYSRTDKGTARDLLAAAPTCVTLHMSSAETGDIDKMKILEDIEQDLDGFDTIDDNEVLSLELERVVATGSEATAAPPRSYFPSLYW